MPQGCFPKALSSTIQPSSAPGIQVWWSNGSLSSTVRTPSSVGNRQQSAAEAQVALDAESTHTITDYDLRPTAPGPSDARPAFLGDDD
jgi:hypothetical protein